MESSMAIIFCRSRWDRSSSICAHLGSVGSCICPKFAISSERTSCACRAFCIESVSVGCVRSHSMSVKNVLPLTLILEIDATKGNSSPFARKATCIDDASIRYAEIPAALRFAISNGLAPLKRFGKNRDSGELIASVAGH